MLRHTLLIARREFVERGRSRVFLGVLVGTVLLIVGGLWALDRFGAPGGTSEVVLAGEYPATMPEDLKAAAAALEVDVEVAEASSTDAARAAVIQGDADAALVDGDTILTVGRVEPALEVVLTAGATASARRAAADDLGLAPAELAALMAPVPVDVVDIDPEGPADAASEARGVIAFASVLILFMALLIFGQFVGTGVVEEKQNRVAEVVLAKVSTASLLTGKVLGIGALGLIQIAVIGAATVFGLRLFPPDVEGIDLAAVGAAAVGWMLLWFVLGYLMYSFVYATLGATVSRQEDLQSLAYVPSLLLMPAYFMVAGALGGSSSQWMAPMSLVPPWSPLLMPFRLVTGDASAWEGLVAIVGSVAFIAFLVWFGARVYRGAALRSGPRVSLREAYRGG
ncbi:MAG: ABC transporter permease [Candidatus Nanopelagicales bacterium]